MARSLAGIVALALLAYVALCAFVFAKQRDMMYYPQFTRVDPAETDFSLLHDGVRLRGWVVTPKGRDPILYFGGNAEAIQGNRAAFARWFPGRAVYLVAYRGYGASDGDPNETALLGDALALYDHVQARHPGQPVAIVGRSLGSGVASYVASKRPVSKLALITPFDSLAAVAQFHYRWLPVRWLVRDRYDAVAFLRGYTGPILIVRAGHDQVIPAASTDRLIASLRNAPVVLDLDQAGHNTIDDDPAYGQALSAFLRTSTDRVNE